MALEALNPLWRPNAVGPRPISRDDRELIRKYAALPVSHSGMSWVTSSMNTVAEISPPTVAQIQAWINEIEDLESGYAGQVADGTAHLGNTRNYKGLRPGINPTRRELMDKAGDLEWDVEAWALAEIETVDGPSGTAGGAIAGRLSVLKANILSALDLLGGEASQAYGSFQVVRS
jgi:hypothetical protein